MDNLNVFECINIRNETDIEYKINKQENYSTNIEIRNMLKDKAIFFKITKERAYEIFEKLKIDKDKINMVYEKLISKNCFYDLLYTGEIDINDEDLLIKYPMYKNDIF